MVAQWLNFTGWYWEMFLCKSYPLRIVNLDALEINWDQLPPGGVIEVKK